MNHRTADKSDFACVCVSNCVEVVKLMKFCLFLPCHGSCSCVHVWVGVGRWWVCVMVCPFCHVMLACLLVCEVRAGMVRVWPGGPGVGVRCGLLPRPEGGVCLVSRGGGGLVLRRLALVAKRGAEGVIPGQGWTVRGRTGGLVSSDAPRSQDGNESWYPPLPVFYLTCCPTRGARRLGVSR